MYGSYHVQRSFGGAVKRKNKNPTPRMYGESAWFSMATIWLRVTPIVASLNNKQNAVDGTRAVPALHGSRWSTFS